MKLPQRKVLRKKSYDYTSIGCYFITICTKDRYHFFGEIKNGEMIYTALGLYCNTCILGLSDRRKTIYMHEFVIMPNHIHLLFEMKPFTKNMNKTIINNRREALLARPCINNNKNNNENNNNGQAKSLSLPIYNKNYSGPTLGSIINMFKGSITKFAQQYDISFQRQGRYYDHIIKNEQSYKQIKQYIKNNPKNRKEDMFYES